MDLWAKRAIFGKMENNDIKSGKGQRWLGSGMGRRRRIIYLDRNAYMQGNAMQCNTMHLRSPALWEFDLGRMLEWAFCGWKGRSVGFAGDEVTRLVCCNAWRLGDFGGGGRDLRTRRGY